MNYNLKCLLYKTSMLLVLFMSMICGKVFGAQSVSCHTPRNEKSFEINAQTVVFVDQEFHSEKSMQRRLASVANVKTELIKNGMTKTLIQNGQQHIIHIENQDHFSDLEDYIIIRSREGHEIIYPLVCSNA